ncbi:MAG: lipid biosynthesis B12-binding/radical SAM protein [bacterium]|nr:lipid biosynthesis B12-binding/radical SAM protein [bacterium]
MANIVLISANITREPFSVYPLGMATVAYDLRKKGHAVSELDFLVEDQSMDSLLAFVKNKAPDLIGISLRNIDNCNSINSTSYTEFYREIVANLREVTAVPIVLGGAGYSLFPEILLKKIGADYGIAGEGEEIFAKLVDDVSSGNPPLKKILSNALPVPATDMGAPERDNHIASFYSKQGGMLNIQTKRGCPFRCAYCTYPTLEGRLYRYRPAGSVVDEIEMLIKNHNLEYYFMADSVFNDSDGKYLEIAQELVRRQISVPWMAYFKPDRFKREDVALLRKAGLNAVEWGTDCSSDTTLKGMGKSFTWSQVKESNDLFTTEGISSAHFIIFGGPGETKETVTEGLDNISKLANCVVFAATGVRVLPGTPIEQHAISMGILSSGLDLLEPFFYFSPDTPEPYLDKAIGASFASRTDRVYPMGEDIERVNMFHKMGYKGPVWDMLLGKRKSGLRRADS